MDGIKSQNIIKVGSQSSAFVGKESWKETALSDEITLGNSRCTVANWKEMQQMLQETEGSISEKENSESEKKAEKRLEEEQKTDVSGEAVSMDSLAEQLVNTCRFLAVDRELYIFNGKIYEKVTNTELIEIVQRNLPKQVLRRIPNIRKVQDVRAWLVGHPRVPKLTGREAYVMNRYLIPFANGIYDVEEARFLPFSPQQIVFYQLDAEYQADCEGLPPRFARFLSENFGRDEVCAELLLEILGYIGMPSNDAKKFFVFGIARDSGKSLLANFCSAVLGREMVSRVGLHNMRQRFYLNETVGKCANFSMDLKESVLREDDVEVIKTMSGECEIEAEGKYEDPRMAFSTCKLVCGTNHPVRLKRGDTALWERMVVMPFTRSCPEENKDIRLLDKLLEERDAIMTCAAWAATRLYQRNFVFVEPPMAKRLKGGWIAGSGGCVEHFIEEYCEVTGDGNDFIESRDLYDQYEQCTLDPVSENQFMYQVRQQFVPELPKKRKRIGNRIATGVFGIRWKED